MPDLRFVVFAARRKPPPTSWSRAARAGGHCPLPVRETRDQGCPSHWLRLLHPDRVRRTHDPCFLWQFAKPLVRCEHGETWYGKYAVTRAKGL